MSEMSEYIEAFFKSLLDWIPDKIIRFLKWLHPLKVVPIVQDCWWSIGSYQHNPSIQLIINLMVTNQSDKQIKIIGFSPIDKRISNVIHSMINVIKENHAIDQIIAIDPIIAPNTTEKVMISSFFQPVIANNTEALKIKTVLKNSLGKHNKIRLSFKSAHNR